MVIDRLDSERKRFIKYYKLKQVSTALWLAEIVVFLAIRLVARMDYGSLLLNHIIFAIGLGVDFMLICCLRRIYKAALSGEPLRSANVGIEIKVENAEAGSSETSGVVFEATLVTEIRSFAVKNVIEDQDIEPNSTITVKDYTKAENVSKNEEEEEKEGNVDVEEIQLD